MPRPSEYARPSRPARAGSPRFHDIEMIAASVGPMHGVQPTPSANPSSGAPISPARPRVRGRKVRCAMPTNPRKTKPRAMMTTPKTRVSTLAYCSSRNPNVPPRIVTATNTTVNPAMNKLTPSSSRPRSVVTARPPCIAEFAAVVVVLPR